MQPHDNMIPPSGTPEEQLAATWDELGRTIQTTRSRLLIRTWPFAQRIGRVWLPPTQQKFYKGLPHSKMVRATVMSVGPDAPVKPGAFIVFPQTFFARYRPMIDGTFLGWVDWRFIHGILSLDASDLETDEPGVAAPAVRTIADVRAGAVVPAVDIG